MGLTGLMCALLRLGTRPGFWPVAERESNDEAGPGAVIRVDADRAAVADDDVVGDREPEPRAALFTAPRLVDAGEPLEDPGGLTRGEPGTVVRDREHHPATVFAEGQGDP